ncbi:hypothetical protein RvY_02803-2 [Ramazzottius varieornatus]|nr:hypothetical protein RvY_02803-2 [Ramazzottius varieornatus]
MLVPCLVLILLTISVLSCNGTLFTKFADEHGNSTNTTLIEPRSALNRDKSYGRWPSSRILYKIGNGYTPFQRTSIREAMTQIQTDVSNCIRFTEFDTQADKGEDFINIAPSDVTLPKADQVTCFTAPGRDLTKNGRGQSLVMFSGPGGCMDNKRDIMKILANVLGLRNEFSRPDRDNFILVQPQNFRAEFRNADLYRKYQPSEVEYQNFQFDYQSITMYSMDRFAIPGTVAYHLINPGSFIGNLPRLSKGDCQGLSAHYGCTASFCSDAYEEQNAILQEKAMVPKDPHKKIPMHPASWNLADLEHWAKELNKKPGRPGKGFSRRPFLIRPIAIL